VASAHDVVLERAARRAPPGRSVSSSKLAWLDAFEPITARSRPLKKDRPLAKATDLLLGEYRP
jgi:hypothetical protein